MFEEIITYLRQHPEGVSSSELASKFLKIQNANSSFAHLTVNSILSKNRKCYQDAQGNWHIRTASSSDSSLKNLPLSATFVLGHPEKKDRNIYYIALWQIFPHPQYIRGGWTVDQNILQKTYMADLCSQNDESFDQKTGPAIILQIENMLKSTLPVFLSRSEFNLFKYALIQSGIDLTDDYFYIQDFIKAGGIDIEDPESLSNLSQSLLGKSIESISAHNRGQLFAECIKEMIEALIVKGIDTRDDLDIFFNQSSDLLLKGKEFSFNDICSLPSSSGIFAFKNKDGKYLYIGKTNNLKRKILRFLISFEDNPSKLKELIQNSHTLITHQCNSELETILYEHRLIKKYSPDLNRETNEVLNISGSPVDVDNYIVVIPDNQKSLLLTFWFSKYQRIRIKPFDFKSKDTFINELNQYFSNRENTEPLDQLELNLAFKWIKKNQDDIVIIPVSSSSSGSEILESIKYYAENF